MAVLRGFKSALEREKICVIQFEYGITHLPARTYLFDIYEFLQTKNFKLGRLLPTGVVFADYDPVRDEAHTMGNYVAVLKKHARLIRELAIN